MPTASPRGRSEPPLKRTRQVPRYGDVAYYASGVHMEKMSRVNAHRFDTNRPIASH